MNGVCSFPSPRGAAGWPHRETQTQAPHSPSLFAASSPAPHTYVCTMTYLFRSFTSARTSPTYCPIPCQLGDLLLLMTWWFSAVGSRRSSCAHHWTLARRSSPIFSRSALPCPALPCPVLPCPILSWPSSLFPSLPHSPSLAASLSVNTSLYINQKNQSPRDCHLFYTP